MSDSDESGVSAGEPLRRKGKQWREWVLLDGDRLWIGFGIAALFAAFFGAAIAVDLVPLDDHQPTFYLYSAFIGGNFTLITVVVSINQLLLSRELSSPGQLENQIQNVVDYRETVEDSAGQLAPVEPLGFLRLLFENTRQEAQQLGGMAAGPTSGAANDEIGDCVRDLTEHADHIGDLLCGSETDIFSVLSVTLTTNYARRIHQIRTIRERHEGEISEPIRDAMDSLIDSLRKIDIARQYFKSIYLQDELSQLSRLLFYTGLPAEGIATLGLLTFTGAGPASIPPRYVPVFVLTVVVVGFTPLAMLCSFILRIATVTQRTAATLPFTTPRQEQ